MDDAVRYLRIVFIGSLFVNFAQSSNMVMRGEGVMKTSMMIMGFGAKNFERVKTLMRVFVSGATILSLIFYIPVMIAPETMLRILIPDNTMLVTMGTGSLRLFFSTYITLGLMIMSITLFQSMGQGGKAAALTILRQIAFFIPLSLILPRVLPSESAVQGVFLAPVVTDLLVLILSLEMVISAFRKFNTVKKVNSSAC